MGYGERQVASSRPRNAVDADLVLSATPIDLTRLVTLNKPITRVHYELAQVDGTPLSEVIEPIVVAARAPALAGGA
jgi:predicted GTPase